MPSHSDLGTLLIVACDVVLGQVLSRVLARKGYTLFLADDPAQALHLVKQHSVDLVLIDDGFRCGSGRQLAARLHSRYPGLRLLLLTDARGDDLPKAGEWAMPATARSGLVRVLTKPLNVTDLRQAVQAALAVVKEHPMRFSPAKVLQGVVMAVIGLLLLAGVGLVTGLLPTPWASAGEGDYSAPPKQELGVKLVKGQPHTLAVPLDVRLALGIRRGNRERLYVVHPPTQTRPLVMRGSTLLNPVRLWRGRVRFTPAELVEVGMVDDITEKGSYRELRTGDEVKKGDLLGVFYSDVVGNKKNDLVDAILQVDLDQQIYNKAKAGSGAVPSIFILNALRTLLGDMNAINRAMNTLKTWNVPEKDIEALVGKRIMEAIKGEADWNLPKKDIQALKDKAKDPSQWGRVEFRSPMDGILIERNATKNELFQDPTVNLFQVADLTSLSVQANVPEDDVPALQALQKKNKRMKWLISTVGSKPIPGFVDDIGVLIDPNQHTAVVKGRIKNPGKRLRAGQFITATVQLPPPEGVVEIPMDALVEDGQQAIVFVQTDPKKHHYTMRRVQVTHRFERVAFVRSTDIPEKEQLTDEEKDLGLLPKEPLREGEKVLVRGALELKAALLDKESEPSEK
jgi:cobalt-zinc-cadmium efflux system membrane fusion protein